MEYPQEKIDRLNDYFDGEERRSQKQNGENIFWLEMSEEEIEEILELKLSYKIYQHAKKDEAFYLGTLDSFEENTEYEPYDVKDAVTEVDNYFFTFEYLELYQSAIQGIGANYYHITNNVDLPADELEELKTLVDNAKSTYESFRLEEKIIRTEEEAEKYAEKLGKLFKFTDEIAG